MTQSEIQQQFSHMNPMQRQAVFATEGPLLILAGAGSGKTTVLVNRIAYILQSGLCRPWNILAITFTNKAAGELKERICSAVPEGGADIWAATFHSTCARILRRYGDRLGYSSHFTVYATDDQKRLMKEIVKQLNIDEKILPVKSVLSEISKAKDKMQTPAEMLREADHDYRKQSIAKAYEIYQKRLQTADAMDFDDLLCKAVELFRQNPEILGYYQNQFKYIMVDEYQDTNRVQYEFVRMLAEKHGNICVVGDDDQSIYKFRGATIENILSFENTFKGAQIIRLEQNYRSLHTCEDERDEAAFIARTIMDGVADGRRYADYAILYRTNAQSNAIEQALSRSGVPHRIIGGHRFYDREEIRDMIAYLQVINNPHDDVRLRRIINVPKRGIGGRTLEIAAEIGTGLGESIYTIIKDAGSYPQLSRSAAKLKSFVALIDGLIEAEESGDYSLAELYNLILEHTNYEAYLRHEKENADVRIENIEELSSNIIKFEEDYGEEADLSGFLEEISLMTDIDNYDAEADTCVMMTLHSAKGLEFPVVFITGMEDGLFPSIASMMNPEEIGEERRLAYVGITRAKEKLYLTKTRTRMLFGSTTYNKESCFVSEIPDELMERTGERKKTFLYGSAYKDSGKATAVGVPSASGAAPKKQPFYQKPAVKSGVTYSVGDTVLHKVFGKGLVMSAQRMGNDTLLEIAFDKAGTKKLMANFCKMEKL